MATPPEAGRYRQGETGQSDVYLAHAALVAHVLNIPTLAVATSELCSVQYEYSVPLPHFYLSLRTSRRTRLFVGGVLQRRTRLHTVL